jgi:hypothetical protein
VAVFQDLFSFSFSAIRAFSRPVPLNFPRRLWTYSRVTCLFESRFALGFDSGFAIG